MQTIQRALGQWLLLVLALVGAGIAIYLTTVHYAQVPLFCSAQGVINCERVTSSSYSVIPGTMIPITLPGLAWFVVSALLALLGLRQRHRWIRGAQLAWAILGMLVVLYLVYVELVLLHTLCLWCTAVHVIVFISLLLTMVEWYRTSQRGEDTPEEGEVAVPTPR